MAGDEQFTQLIDGLGVSAEHTVLCMRLAFIVGTGQAVDVPAAKRVLERSTISAAMRPGEPNPCKCHETAGHA